MTALLTLLPHCETAQIKIKIVSIGQLRREIRTCIYFYQFLR
jgi:hypothetical protein